MSDKTRKTFPISINILDGEIPSGVKFSAIVSQTRGALNIIENLLGDPWNMAGDPVLSPASDFTKYALHQANIARSIGQMGLLNSLVPGTDPAAAVNTVGPLSAELMYTDSIGLRYPGASEGVLKYKPNLTPTGANTTIIDSTATIIQGQFQSTPQAIASTGDWHVSTNGKLYTFDPIPSVLKITYNADVPGDTIDPIDNEIPGNNVIPDPLSSVVSPRYNGCKISFANGTDNTAGYHIWLPVRKHLGAATNKNVERMMDGAVSENVTATPNSLPIVAYQSDSADAALTYGNHYRYLLPRDLDGLAAGTTLPAGFIYLWDEQMGTIVEGVTFTVPVATAQARWKVTATGSVLSGKFGTAVGNGIITSDATQLAADYISRFRIIVPGATIARSLYSLWISHLNHGHSNDQLPDLVSHSSLDNLVTPPYHASLNSAYPSTAPTFTKSRWQNDDHSQYLHRAGSTSTDLGSGAASRRGDDDNAIWHRLKVRGSGMSSSAVSLVSNESSCQVIVNAYPLTISNSNISSAITFADETTQRLSISATLGVGIFSTSDGVAMQRPIVFDGTFGPRLYFSDQTTYGNVLDAALPDNYIDFDESVTYTFFAGGGAGATHLVAGLYDYASTGRSSTYTVQSTDFQSIQTIDVASGPPIFIGYSVSNTHASNGPLQLVAPVHLPNGAIIRTSHTQGMNSESNGTDPLTITFYEVAKATGTSTSRLVLSRTTGSRANTTGSVSSDITIDNTLSGTYIYLLMSLPDTNGGGNTPALYNVTISYDLPTVNN